MGLEEVAQVCMDNPASGATKNISNKKYLQKVCAPDGTILQLL